MDGILLNLSTGGIGSNLKCKAERTLPNPLPAPLATPPAVTHLWSPAPVGTEPSLCSLKEMANSNNRIV